MRVPFKKIKQEIKSNRRAKVSNAFLINNCENIDEYNSIIDLAEEYDFDLNRYVDGFEYHFVNLRNIIRYTLVNHSIFIGGDVVEELIFLSLCKNQSPIIHCIDTIRDFKLHEPGFIIYPLHSFGILGFGFVRAFSERVLYYSNPKKEIAISAQPNSKEYLYKFIENAMKDLQINQKVNKDSIEHYLRSRPLKWLLNNPIMIQKFRSYSGDYYANQRLITLKLEISLSFIYLTQSLLINSELSNFESHFSTKSLNNWETYDINHYLLFSTQPGQKAYYETRCIPMNYEKTFLNEISQLNVEFYPNRVVKHHDYDLAIKIFNEFEKTYLKLFNSKSTGPKKRHFDQLYLSLKYFRKSFLSSHKSFDNVINLCIAFEVLLLDKNEKFKKREPILDKLDQTLKYRKSKKDMIESVDKLILSRNEIVHGGFTDKSNNLELCRKAFSLSFLKLNKTINYGSVNPGTLVTDVLKQISN